MPEICVLDPDGDIVRHLVATHRARRARSWPCYHTRLHVYRHGRERLGIIGGAVGAPFAVLVAEELFASGSRLLISVTSAGEIRPRREPPPYVVLIERALRDDERDVLGARPPEGTIRTPSGWPRAPALQPRQYASPSRSPQSERNPAANEGDKVTGTAGCVGD